MQPVSNPLRQNTLRRFTNPNLDPLRSPSLSVWRGFIVGENLWPEEKRTPGVLQWFELLKRPQSARSTIGRKGFHFLKAL
ncbi:hypothetical protein VTN77DRAFT_6935 [Rasamsonia byssochlamydoides]|uniref:uncharacterized protein n=1 Tax=Rasamsonia byssochlamydoides TaxID=89139 RepID=UPI003743B22E